MATNALHLIDKLAEQRRLTLDEYQCVVSAFTPDTSEYARVLAESVRKRIYGNHVYIRGLIEISNYCKNDCYYCGIRRSNTTCERYRLTPNDIAQCAHNAYNAGCRTFVLQGGEDPWFTDERLVAIVRSLREAYPTCAITLSLGERSEESYQLLKDAGANRYLLRHETATPQHYAHLHPANLSYSTRMNCLHTLKRIGFVTGCGFMVGSPGQTTQTLASDLKFVEEFAPEMCGIGPFIPHHATPFAHEATGSVDLTCYLLSLLRLMHPTLLLPSTTALGTLDSHGLEKGILAGANVIMPNISPYENRSKYEIYENKAFGAADGAEQIQHLRKRMQDIGYEIVVDPGHPKVTD